MKTYPAIEFVARRGRFLALILGLGVLLIDVIASITLANPWFFLYGIVIGGCLWALLRVGAELVEVVSETLLPR
jgi:hypothetical protein